MKYYTDFLTNTTHKLRQLGKVKKALDYDLIEAKIKVRSLENAASNVESEIKALALKINTKQQYNDALKKTEVWNNTPLRKLNDLNKQ